VFRELAVSYLNRFDLAHVDPTEGSFDALGKGIEEGKTAEATRFVSKGLTRSRTDKLRVMQGGADLRNDSDADGSSGGGSDTGGSHGGKVTALSSARSGDHVDGATALKHEPEQQLSPAQALEQLAWQKPNPDAKALAAERRAEAKARGYEGEMCGECGNFTLVRNGTCMKCDTCGSTTGCS